METVFGETRTVPDDQGSREGTAAVSGQLVRNAYTFGASAFPYRQNPRDCVLFSPSNRSHDLSGQRQKAKMRRWNMKREIEC